MVSVQTIKTCVVIKKKMGDMPHALPRTCFPSTTPNCSQGFLRKQHILCWRTFSEVTWLNSIWSYCNLQVWTLLGKVTRTCCYFLFFLCACVCVFELCHKIQQWWWWGNQVAACLQNRSETSIIETFTMQACRETVDSVCLCAHVSERQAQMFLCTPFASTHTGGARCLITEICPVEKHIHDAPKSSITHADSWTRIVASYVKTWN